MITLFYLENNQKKKMNFDVPPEDYLSVVKLLKERDYNWYTVDKGSTDFNPHQLTLEFGELL